MLACSASMAIITIVGSAPYSLMCCFLTPRGLGILPSAFARLQMMLEALAQNLCAFMHMLVLQMLACWAKVALKAGTYLPKADHENHEAPCHAVYLHGLRSMR